MKKLLFFLLVSLVGLSANAQNGRNFELALTGGMYGFNIEFPYLFGDFTCFEGCTPRETETALSYSLGLLGKMPVSEKITVSVGLEYLNGRYTEKGETGFFGRYVLERSNHFFRAPLKVHYLLFNPSGNGFRISPELGVVPQYFSRTRFTEPFSSSSDDFFRKFGWSLDVGIGIQKPLSEAVNIEFVPCFSYALTDYGVQDQPFFKDELDRFVPFFFGLQMRVGWIVK